VNNKIIYLKSILWTLVSFGIVAIAVRIVGGLGATTNLSDSMPWGIWKILNMVAGAALATGGFIFAAIVHIFKIEKYKPFLRLAILIAFLGYGSSLFALFWDIGLPHKFYNPFFSWNHHSFLFEVFWCVSLYFTITVIEILPIIFEKFHADKIVEWLHRISTPIIILGITFSFLHHTSLGSLFLVMPTRLHDLWFTNWIPVLFFLSAIGAGIMMVVLIKLCHSYFYNKTENLPLVLDLARISCVILAIYFIVKIVDLIYHGNIHLLISTQWESFVFIIEIFIGIFIPITIVISSSLRQKISSLVVASSSAVLGLVLNRLNVGIFGLLRTSEFNYFPSFLEISLSFGVIASAILVLIYMIDNFKVFPAPFMKMTSLTDNDHFLEFQARKFLTDRARYSMIIVLGISLAAVFFYQNATRGMAKESISVHAPRGFDETRSVLIIDGDLDNDYVKFKHEFHKEKLGKNKSCVLCHHLDLPNDHSSACWRCHRDMNRVCSIFNHDLHKQKLGGKFSCTQCHKSNEAKNHENSKPCVECHKKDMRHLPDDQNAFSFITLSYKEALHNQCISCHRKQETTLKNSNMSNCLHCHKESWKKQFELPDSSSQYFTMQVLKN
jgi:Ni/Fe-hydrogenase subunit HybB-like protein